MSYKTRDDIKTLEQVDMALAAQDGSDTAASPAVLSALLSQVEKLETELKNKQQYIDQLQQDVVIDPLTNVYNRRMFESELSRIIHGCNRYGRHAAVVMIDLDGFKSINDSLGHLMGDQLLCHVAKQLMQNVRSSDLVCRLGGDEFAVILTEVRSAADAEKCAQFLTETVAATPCVSGSGSAIYAAISAGSYTFGRGETMEEIITQADAAMYEKKRSKS